VIFIRRETVVPGHHLGLTAQTMYRQAAHARPTVSPRRAEWSLPAAGRPPPPSPAGIPIAQCEPNFL